MNIHSSPDERRIARTDYGCCRPSELDVDDGGHKEAVGRASVGQPSDHDQLAAGVTAGTGGHRPTNGSDQPVKLDRSEEDGVVDCQR